MEYLSVAEFAEAAGITPQAVYKRIKGDLEPFVKVEDGVKTIDSSALKVLKPMQQTKREKELLQKLEEAERLNEQLKAENHELLVKLNANNDRLLDNNEKMLVLMEKQAQQQENYQLLLAQQQQVFASSLKALPTVEEKNQELKEVGDNDNKQGFFSRIFRKRQANQY